MSAYRQMTRRCHEDKVCCLVPQDKVEDTKRLSCHAMEVLLAARHTYEEYCLMKPAAVPTSQPPHFYDMWSNAMAGRVFQPSTQVAPAFSARSFPTNISATKSSSPVQVGANRNDPLDVPIQRIRPKASLSTSLSSTMGPPFPSSVMAVAQG